MSTTYPTALDESPLLEPLYDDLSDDDRVTSLAVKRGHDSDDIVFHVSTIDDVAEYGLKSEYLGYPTNPRDDGFTDQSVITSPHESASRAYPAFPVIIFEH